MSSSLAELLGGLSSLTPIQVFGIGLAALFVLRIALDRRHSPAISVYAGQNDHKEKDKLDMSAPQTNYEPSILDVLVVKAMLAKGLHLPPEIIDNIVDQAEYWPHTSTAIDYAVETGALHAIRGRSLDSPEDELLLRSVPLGFPRWPKSGSLSTPEANMHRAENTPIPPGTPFPSEVFQDLIGSPITMVSHPCRRIVFTIRSRDQGWGGEYEHQGTYLGSWTWFEAGLQRWCLEGTDTMTTPAEVRQAETPEPTSSREQVPPPSKPSFTLGDLATIAPHVVRQGGSPNLLAYQHELLPNERYKIQSNKTAARDITEHRVVWSYTDNTPGTDEAAIQKLAEAGRGEGTADGSFVRDLRLGDVVTIWGMARFPMWVNYVDSVQVDVYWAI